MSFPALPVSTHIPPAMSGLASDALRLQKSRKLRGALYETMFAEGRIDGAMHETLAWYDALRSLSLFGPFRTDVTTTTSRGVPYAALPVSDWQQQARTDLSWARDQIPEDQHELFEGLIDGTLRIDTVGRRWPGLDMIEGRLRAEKQFLIAANFLFVSSGARRGQSELAA